MEPTRKLVAILCSDVVGYSRLMNDDEQATMDSIVDTRRVMQAHVAQHGGRVVDHSGDALLAEFASAVEAVRCALEIQQAMALANATRPEHRQMKLRIGLNLGDVIEADGALYGDGVNIAARVQTAGEPGGVCVSGAIHDQIEGKLPLRFEPVGERNFKNIAKSVRVYHVRDATDRGVASVAGSPVAKPEPARTRSNLPGQLSSFVGRASDIAAVRQMLTRHRLVTLLGAGGIGKTRLSLEVAAEVSPGYPDGVWFVELAALSDPRLVKQAVASALGIKEEVGRPMLDALLGAVADRQLLLILDNCEHVLPACAELSRQLLQGCGRLRVMASSREDLHVAGEASYLVPALSTPDPTAAITPEAARAHEAVQLFVKRAVAVQPDFELTPHNVAAVASICRQLDGIPLAIELAAARVHALSVENIASRLSDRFHLLTRGDRNALPRQQTLRALIDWSYDLLTDAERVLFRRLAVFAGGWTLEAAEAVCAGSELEARDVPDLLGRLVERSMVESEVGGKRYRLLQTVRQYAQDRIDEAGDDQATRDRHLGFYLGVAEAASAQLAGPNQGEWLERLDPEQENFLAAHAWCDRAESGAESGLRLMFALKLYLFNRGLLAVLRWGVLDALARAGAESRSVFRCRALHTAGQVAFYTGRFAEAQAHLEDALSIARDVGDTGRAAAVLQVLGMNCMARADWGAAHRFLEEALTLAQEHGDRRELAAALNALAQLHRVEGTLDEAEPLYEQGLALARELGDRESVAVALLNLAMVAIGRGAHQRAGVMLLEAIDIVEALGSRITAGNVLAVATGLASLRGDWAQVGWFLAATQSQLRHTGIRLDPADEAFLAPLVARAREQLAPERFAEAEGAAEALGHEQVMAATRQWLHRQGS